MPTGPQCKLRIFQTFHDYAELRLPPADQRRLLAALSPEARQLFDRISGNASAWVSHKAYFELVEAVRTTFPTDYIDILRNYGQFLAERDLKGVFSAFARVASVSLGLTIVVKTFNAYFTTGHATVVSKSPGRFEYEIRAPYYSHSIHVAAGFVAVLMEMLGAKDSKVEGRIVQAAAPSSGVPADDVTAVVASWSP